jgi:hypothetical protein
MNLIEINDDIALAAKSLVDDSPISDWLPIARGAVAEFGEALVIRALQQIPRQRSFGMIFRPRAYFRALCRSLKQHQSWSSGEEGINS